MKAFKINFKTLIVCASLFISLNISAQTMSFSVSVNKDTVLFGNYIKVEFSASNAQGKFEAPKFQDFDIVSGPNSSSSMYMINGETTSTMKYSYYIKPRKEGEFFIENAYLVNQKDEDKSLETSPYKIVVLPNPEGIIEEEDSQEGFNSFFHSFPSIDNSFPNMDIFGNRPIPTPKEEAPKKPKRKIKRI